MYIGIMADNADLKSRVSESFAEAKFLLIADDESGGIRAAYKKAEFDDCAIARKLIEHDCEAVICGPIEEKPFLIIADEGCITRYYGVGMTAEEALGVIIAQGALPYIVDYIGGSGCSSTHTACDCSEEP